jgi:RNA polymerase sigma-70 factor (ECF subfamily)
LKKVKKILHFCVTNRTLLRYTDRKRSRKVRYHKLNINLSQKMQHNESDMHRNDISPHHGDMLGERFTSEQIGGGSKQASRTSEQIGGISGRASSALEHTGSTSREKTFTNVFQRLNRRLLHLARGILGNEMEAEDAVQESFCRMWERREQMGSEGEVAAMITTTVKNVSIDTLRRQSHTGTIDIDEVAETPSTAEAETNEAEERFRRIEALIESELSPTARHVLRRREYDGADFDTIAQELNLQPTAVRMHLSRARQKIMNAYLEQQRHET